jgi:hypothetical protein
MSYQNQKKQTTFAQIGGPQEMDVMLRYTSFNAGIGSGASAGQVLLNPNSYIPQNSGTEAAAGFVTMAMMYDQYRVTKMRVKFIAVNRDATSVEVVSLLHNETPAGETIGTLRGNPRSRLMTLGSAEGGASRCIQSMTSQMRDLVGSPATDYDDTYRAVINANPSDVVWGIIRVFGTGTMTNGVDISVEVTQWIRFYTKDIVTQATAPDFVLTAGMKDKDILDAIHNYREKRKQLKALTPPYQKEFEARRSAGVTK